MGFRLYKRVSLAPGLRLNLSRSGPSLTLGGGGLHYTVGRRGTRTSVGIPGTGAYYTRQHSWSARAAPAATSAPPPSSLAPTASTHSPLWWLFVFPFELLAALAVLAVALAGLAVIAGLAALAVGFLALLFSWPHGVAVVLAVIAALFAIGATLCVAAGVK